MAGFSNLSIAVTVMSSPKVAGSADDLQMLEEQIASLLHTLDHLQQKPSESLPDKDLNMLSRFLRELQRQGEIDRDATFSSEERPRPFSVLGP
jgi:hypothetical protein